MKIFILPLSLLFLVLLGSAVTTEKEFSYSKALTKSYVFVPSGTAIVNGDSVTVQSFYMYNKEVTNLDYLEFLFDLKTRGETELLKIAEIDSVGWNFENTTNQAYVTYYHSHPAYKEYPVINVSYEGAQLYCKWLGEKYDQKFGTTGKFKFRLPERAEYIRAARGDSKASYSWKTNSLRNEKGQVLCNFAQLGAEDIHRNTETGKYEIIIAPRDFLTNGFADVLAPSESYWPNEFKIYNLNGNAAEMIAEKGISMGGSWRNTGYDVRVESEHKYTEPNPWTGFRVVMTYTKAE